MADISQSTYNHRDFLEIMEMVDKRLNDSGKNWRHVFKALTLLDYLLHTGAEAVIAYARENIHVIKTLKEFQYIDDDGKDQGANVRQKCKDIVALLADETRLREARQTRADMRGRMGGSGSRPENDGSGSGAYYNEDFELQKALEESKKTAQQDQKRRAGEDKEEEELRRALELSEKEAIERRMRERDEAAAKAAAEPAKDNIIDFFGGLEDTTPANPYAQQPQQTQTSYDPFSGFGGADPFAAQQQQQLQQQYALQQQQQLALQQQLAQQQFQQNQMLQNQMQNSNPFGTAPANPMQDQLTGNNDALARGSGPIDPFASLAASRTGGASGATQSNPFGVAQGAGNDIFGGGNQQSLANQSTGGGFGNAAQVSAHNTGSGFGGFNQGQAQNLGGGFGGFGQGGQAIQQHNTGGNLGSNLGGFGTQPLQAHNTGGPFGNRGGIPAHLTGGGLGGFGGAGSQPISQHNTGSGFGTPAQGTGGFNTPNKSANDLVNLDASSLMKGSGSGAANNFGLPAAKNPFATAGTSAGGKFQWEAPKPSQPTLAQLATQNTTQSTFGGGGFNGAGGNNNNAFGGMQTGFGGAFPQQQQQQQQQQPFFGGGVQGGQGFGNPQQGATSFGGQQQQGFQQQQNAFGQNPFGAQQNQHNQQQMGGGSFF
ncbi:uncharacterized protein EV422DRAFT_406431 [Fimicolochytrium jonesii]|uniref:uncharacterized protein n=1 Tax=Fimicolochytrium jonesii TaxID=1396493 RepID=UPI0022FF38CE|nr:uncharacterized protein EV422DRAFT_406431 [Fimicolochytrium jonesii]KAI8822600.1 hypothetical protein EV422DRAFT_406431 [Fimicolochytrium jonesii]